MVILRPMPAHQPLSNHEPAHKPMCKAYRPEALPGTAVFLSSSARGSKSCADRTHTAEAYSRQQAEVRLKETAPNGSGLSISILPYRAQRHGMKRRERGQGVKTAPSDAGKSDTYYSQLSAQIAISQIIMKDAAFTKDVQSDKRELRHICCKLRGLMSYAAIGRIGNL